MLNYSDIAKLETVPNVYKMQTKDLCAVCGRELWVLADSEYDYHYCRKCRIIKYLSHVPEECDKGRICPKCGKVMVLCEDERTYNQFWECDGCGHKEAD